MKIPAKSLVWTSQEDDEDMFQDRWLRCSRDGCFGTGREWFRPPNALNEDYEDYAVGSEEAQGDMPSLTPYCGAGAAGISPPRYARGRSGWR